MGIAFNAPIVISKRPRVSGTCSTSKLQSCPWKGRVRDGLRLSRKCGKASVRMQSGESLTPTALDDGESFHSGFIPEGAFTILLKVKLRSGVAVTDGKVVLAEYARKTCAEPGVIRCDVLYEVSSRGVPKSDFYEIWILFQNSASYADHEKTSHAAKLRLWLENPTGGDNAVVLTRLSYSSSVLELLRPSAVNWKSGIDYVVEERDREDERLGMAAMSLLSGSNPKASAALRKSLNVLASNVGLENVTILIATATASCAELLPSLTGVCEEYMEEQDRSPGVVRTGMLVARNNPLTIVIMTVHDVDSGEGAFFDVDLGTDFVDGEWSVRRYFAAFPDKLGWERIEAPAEEIQEKKPEVFLGPVVTEPSSTAAVVVLDRQQESITGPEQQFRLVQGASAFDMVKDIVRDMAKTRSTDIKAMIISGWNQARVALLLDQLQPKEGDPAEILFRFGLSVDSCEASTRLLRKGVEFVRDYKPDLVIGYGGGAVMDMTKAVGAFGYASDEVLEEAIRKVNTASSEGASRVVLVIPSMAVPVLLICGNVSVGAEFADICVMVGEDDSGLSRRVCVDLVDPPDKAAHPTEKTVLRDSRLISPRYLNGFHAAQGALLLVCRGIETLMSLYETPNLPAVKYAEETINEASETIVAALREPKVATGQTRDPLTEAQTKVGIAADCTGRIGLCSRLSLAVVDNLIDGPETCCFRKIMIRVTAAVMKELCSWRENADACYLVERVRKAFLVRKAEDISRRLIARAEDTDVYRLSELGMSRRTIPTIAASVVQTLRQEESSPIEKLFTDQVVLERILHSAMDQQYEL